MFSKAHVGMFYMHSLIEVVWKQVTVAQPRRNQEGKYVHDYSATQWDCPFIGLFFQPSVSSSGKQRYHFDALISFSWILLPAGLDQLDRVKDGQKRIQGTVEVWDPAQGKAKCMNRSNGTKDGTCQVAQAGLELLSSSDLPTSDFQSAGITDLYTLDDPKCNAIIMLLSHIASPDEESIDDTSERWEEAQIRSRMHTTKENTEWNSKKLWKTWKSTLSREKMDEMRTGVGTPPQSSPVL
ncbi:hypothetical protein AAY473_007831 [Plecturocebus cupreus]